jgi:uncharacterized NAD(P)/FAD-binding protein YdhS
MEHRLCVIGGGPRATYVLLHLLAAWRTRPLQARLQIHLIEPTEFGAGAIYCTSQPGFLRLNTIASQVTAYPDDTVVSPLPVLGGPTLYEWSRTPQNGVAINSYPSRQHTGRYLVAVFNELLRCAPPSLTIACHRAAAVGMEQAQDVGWTVRLSDGYELRCDAVVLAVGGAASARTDCALLAEQFGIPQSSAEEGIIAQPYPIKATLDRLRPGKNVGLIGLGLTALDIIGGCTVGRGGKFLRENGRLRYLRSGAEPHFVAWSRSGLPLMTRGVNQKPIDEKVEARFLTEEALDKLRGDRLRTSGTAKLDFVHDILGLLVQEMAHAYETAVARRNGQVVPPPGHWNGNHRAPKRHRWLGSKTFCWEQLVHPVPGSALRTEDRFKSFFLDYLRWDIAEAHQGNLASPVKSACDAIRDLRDKMRYAVEFGGLTPASHRTFDMEFTPLHNRLAVGPPIEAAEELLALVEAGVVDPFCGPQPHLRWDSSSGQLSICPTVFRGPNRDVSVVINARIPPTDVATTASPLIRNLLEGGHMVSFENALHGTVYRPGGIAVTESYKVINKHHRALDNLFAIGAITEGCTWYSQVLARPYVNSRSMRDAASVAQSLWDYFAGRDTARAQTTHPGKPGQQGHTLREDTRFWHRPKPMFLDSPHPGFPVSHNVYPLCRITETLSREAI